MKEKFIKGAKWFFYSFIWLGALLLIIDFISKQIVLNTMEVGESIDIIPSFFYFQYVVNDGMAFGLDFNNEITNRIIFISASIIGGILIIGFYAWKYKKLTKFSKASLMLMAAGCLGNLIDRMFYNASYLNYSTNGVVDFIAFDFGSYSFPRFNIADSCLVIGTIMLIVYLFVSEYKENKKEKCEVKNTQNNEKVLSNDEKQKALIDENKTIQMVDLENNNKKEKQEE